MVTRRTFGHTWWGKAWIDALEQRARLDPNRLPRGRTYARKDRASTLTIEPGSIRAFVQGSRPTPYAVVIRVPTFTPDQWQLVIAAIVVRAAHAAAMFDGELLPEILDDVSAVGIDLLPGSGDVKTRCSCPDWAEPCKHAAAVCYLMADEMDRDPFEVFHLRGMARDELLAAMRETRRQMADASSSSGVGSGSGSASASGSGSGSGASAARPSLASRTSLTAAPTVIAARDAFARPQATAAELWALGSPPALAHAGHPAPLAVSPPRSSGLDADDLHALASDAAARAWELSRDEGDGGLSLSEDRDLARRAAALIGTRRFGALAKRSGLPSRHLLRHALAWRHGGEEGIEVLSDTWMPDAELLEEGRAALAGSRGIGDGRGSAVPAGSIRVRANTLMAGNVQLRLARSGRWYRLAKVAGHWEIEDGPAADPSQLFTDR